MKHRINALASVAVLALSSGAAHSTVLLNWDQAQAIPPTGMLSFDGVRLSGSNISFDLMSASGTSADGRYHCSNAGGTVVLGTTRCLLSFTTGPLIGVTSSVYQFAGGGSILLTGFLTTAGPGQTQPVISGNPLVLTGTLNAPYIFIRGASGLGQGAGLDIKDLALSEYFGLDQRFRFAITQIALGGCTAGPTFTCRLTQADFQNTQPIPEPGSLALLGFGAIGFALVRRRRSRVA